MSTERQKTKREPISTHKLEKPFQFGTKEITEINIIKRPKGKHIKDIALGGMTGNDSALLLGRISDLETPEILEFELVDFRKASDLLADFL